MVLPSVGGSMGCRWRSHRGLSSRTTSYALPAVPRTLSISSSVISVLLLFGGRGFGGALSACCAVSANTGTANKTNGANHVVRMAVFSIVSSRSQREPHRLKADAETAVHLVRGCQATLLRAGGQHQVPGTRHVHVEIQAPPQDRLLGRNGERIVFQARAA